MIHLANKWVTYPRGIIDDLLVRIDKFVFPADFIVVDMKEDNYIPLIMGRAFLSTARALFDIEKSSVTLRFGNEAITFGVDNAIKYSKSCDDEAFFLDVKDDHLIDEFIRMDEELGYVTLVEGVVDAEKDIQQLEELLQEQTEVEEKEKVSVEKSSRDSGTAPRFFTEEISGDELKFRKEEYFSPPRKNSIIELKPLPSYLEYAFLNGDENYPVIIAANLGRKEKTKLVEILSKRKEAIAWTIADIKGISRTYCTHKIRTE